MPLHCFVSVRTVVDDIPVPAGYDVNSVEVRRSLLGLQSEAPVAVKLRQGDELYECLSENPLTEDQHLSAESTGSWIMSGTLFLSQGLTFWLLGQGDRLEVLEPLSLRGEVAAIATRMAVLYWSGWSSGKRVVD